VAWSEVEEREREREGVLLQFALVAFGVELSISAEKKKKNSPPPSPWQVIHYFFFPICVCSIESKKKSA
jgi:hypothetical protein